MSDHYCKIHRSVQCFISFGGGGGDWGWRGGHLFTPLETGYPPLRVAVNDIHCTCATENVHCSILMKIKFNVDRHTSGHCLYGC